MQSALATVTAILNSNIQRRNSDCPFVPKSFTAKCDDLIELNKRSDSEESLEDVEPSVDDMPTYTLKDVTLHCSIDDCWIVVKDKVYDITDFLLEVNIYI